MRFFFDNCLPPRLARSLNENFGPDGHTFTYLRERFPPNAPDEAWLLALADEGEWIVVSGDLGIIYNKARRAVWMRCGLTTFFFRKGWIGGLDRGDMTWRVFKIWPQLQALALESPPGTCYFVGLRGTFERGPYRSIRPPTRRGGPSE